MQFADNADEKTPEPTTGGCTLVSLLTVSNCVRDDLHSYLSTRNGRHVQVDLGVLDILKELLPLNIRQTVTTLNFEHVEGSVRSLWDYVVFSALPQLKRLNVTL